MDRRESLKSMLLGSIAGGALVSGCAPTEIDGQQGIEGNKANVYGRTEKEKIRDNKLLEEKYFSAHEMETIAILCDLILPAHGEYKAASEAAVADFVEFIVKDIPRHQLPIRGGIMWMDNFANESFGKNFKSCTSEECIILLDQIAYPEEAEPEVSQGVRFFSLMRNLTLTGFYTTKIGIEELGYQGNTPNVWDGVPDGVLRKHGLNYDESRKDQYVDQSSRMDLAQWDDEGNLMS